MSSYSFQGRKRVWTPRDESENRAIFSAQRQETGIKMPDTLKPIYLSHADNKNEIEKWSLKQLMLLLRLYGAHRCLWDVNDPDNRNRKLRKAALIDITAAMDNGVSLRQVVQKINVLRCTYRYEKRKIKQRMRKGIGAKTKLKWFALADTFLRHIPKREKLRKNESTDTDSDLQDTVVFTVDTQTLMPSNDEIMEQEFLPNNIDIKLVKSENFRSSNEDLASEENSLNFSQETTLSVLSEKSTVAEGKIKWTFEESLEFVSLLKAHDSLWNLETGSLSTAQRVDLQKICKAMQMPLRRIEKRFQIFKQTCRKESLRITGNSNHRPQWIWWPLAESLIATSLSPYPPNFVDANQIPPPTPISMTASCPATPLNPLPSVEPFTESINPDDLDALFQNSAEQEVVQMDNSDHPNPPPGTKLVWNGLEDDLLEGKWSLKHSVKFLRLYGFHRCLWDLNHPDYRSRELRSAAIEDIAAAMGYGLNAEYVAKKIKIFRITYMQHRKRMLEAIKQGKEPEIQLRWFPLADSFLRPHIGLRSIKDHSLELPQFDFQYVFANLNLIDPALLTDLRGKGTQNTIQIGGDVTGSQEEKFEKVDLQTEDEII